MDPISSLLVGSSTIACLADAAEDPGTIAFRGSQFQDFQRGVRGAPSFCPSLPVAMIWSSRPSGHEPPQVLESSTVTKVVIRPKNILRIEPSWMSLDEFASILKKDTPEEGGVSKEEFRKILNYLHNRTTGKASGGPFAIRVWDEDKEEVSEEDFPLSFSNPETLPSVARRMFDFEGFEACDRVKVDVYALMDSPTAQTVCKRIGFDAVSYLDVFEGGARAARSIFAEEATSLSGVRETRDLSGRRVLCHSTIRTLPGCEVSISWQRPTLDLIRSGDWKQDRNP